MGCVLKFQSIGTAQWINGIPHRDGWYGKTDVAKNLNAYLDAVEFRIYEIQKELTTSGTELAGDIIKAKFLD